MNTLNRTTRGTRQPCVVQFSLCVPRAMNGTKPPSFTTAIATSGDGSSSMGGDNGGGSNGGGAACSGTDLCDPFFRALIFPAVGGPYSPNFRALVFASRTLKEVR